ncbi:MAG: alanine dehydrogenase [Ignisphaera sp.]
MVDILFLNANEIEKIIDMKRVIELVEVAFKEKGLKRVQMPPKTYLFFTKYDGDLRTMPAYLESLDIAAVKVVNSHPKNPQRYGLPTVMAVIILVDPSSGKPLSIMDGTVITRYRTGAAAAVATKYLWGAKEAHVGLVGAGSVAAYSVEALRHVIKIRFIAIYDIDHEKATRLAQNIQNRYGIESRAVESPYEVVKEAEVIVTATPSRSPIIKNEWIGEDVHINAMGADAPGKEELDPLILKRAKIVVDDYDQAIHSGEINVPISSGLLKPSDIYAELGEIVAGLKKGRESDKEITVFTSTGLAVQDAITAWYIYNEAIRKGVGTSLKLL